MYTVGFSSVCCEYLLVLLVNKNLLWAYGSTKYSKMGIPCRDKRKEARDMELPCSHQRRQTSERTLLVGHSHVAIHRLIENV